MSIWIRTKKEEKEIPTPEDWDAFVLALPKTAKCFVGLEEGFTRGVQAKNLRGYMFEDVEPCVRREKEFFTL